jgi:hypothetical protein
MICHRCNLTVYTGVNTGPPDDEGYRTVTNPKPKRTQNYTPAPEVVEKMVRDFNAYWMQSFKLDINFQFGQRDYQFITFSEPAILRNRLIRKKMESMMLPVNPVIVEPFAGWGADTITFLFNLDPKKIYVCERNDDASKQLRTNVTNFDDALETNYKDPKGRMDYYVGEAKNIFDKVATSPNEIDLLYLDPPWVLDGVTGNLRDNEADNAQLITFLMDNVFTPMQAKNLIPKIIVIKTRFDWKKLSQVMHMLPEKDDGDPQYVQTDTIFFKPLKRTVYFHTLQTTDCVLHRWEHSKIQDTIYPNFKDRDNHNPNPPKQGDLIYLKTVPT